MMAVRNSSTVETVTVLPPLPPVVGPIGLSFAKPAKLKSAPDGAAVILSARERTGRMENFILKVVLVKGEKRE